MKTGGRSGREVKDAPLVVCSESQSIKAIGTFEFEDSTDLVD